MNLLIVSPQIVQNDDPFRIIAGSGTLSLTVCYCSLPGDELTGNEEYINRGVFKKDLPTEYNWVAPTNWSPVPKFSSFWGMLNPGVVSLVRKADCVLVYGYAQATMILAIISAKMFRKRLLISTDAVEINPSGASKLKLAIKRRLLQWLFAKVADGAVVPSSASRSYLTKLRVPPEQIYLTPYVVDNRTIKERAARVSRKEVRAGWNIPIEAPVIVFCGKFLPRKRPQDLVRAFLKMSTSNAYLVLVGDGPLKDELVKLAEPAISRVRFLGLVPYDRLPEVYASGDILVHPAENEPWGLIINEAMLCGALVVVSDRVGAGIDLIEDGKTGFRYPCGEIESLTRILEQVCGGGSLTSLISRQSMSRIAQWSPEKNAEALVNAVRG